MESHIHERILQSSIPNCSEGNINSTEKASMRVAGVLAKSSFLIENLLVDSKHNCEDTELVGLEPTECSVKIQIRKLTRGNYK